MSEKTTPRIDVPEAYSIRVNMGYGSVESGDDFLQKRLEYTTRQQKQVELEADILGVSPVSQPDRFVDAHNTLLEEIRLELDSALPEIKQDVIARTVAYFADGDQAVAENLTGLLSKRLEATERVLVADSLAYSNDMAGSFNGMGRQPVVVSREIITQMHDSRTAEEFHEKLRKVIVAHEVMHGMFTSGAQETWLTDSYSIRNGVEVFDIENPLEMGEMTTKIYGKWLNEATLESFRQTIMETEDVRYEPGVMVLHLLEELSPGIRDELVLAALDSSGPGPVFGKVENLLGPTAIDDVEILLSKVTNFAELENFKDAVVELLPSELRERGRSLLDEIQEEVFKWRPDYKEKRQKELLEATAA